LDALDKRAEIAPLSMNEIDLKHYLNNRLAVKGRGNKMVSNSQSEGATRR
jgi:hypothetical protein